MGIVEAPASDRPNFTAMATLWPSLGSRVHANLFIRTRRGESASSRRRGLLIAMGLRAMVQDLR